MRFFASQSQAFVCSDYLTAVGNAFYLQKMLGHSTLEMTNRCVRSIGIDDL